MTKKEFVTHMNTICDLAIASGSQFNKAVVIAQAALESGWGNSGLTVQANNLFGIKACKSWRGPTVDKLTKEWSKTKGWHQVVARWAAWDSWHECVLYYANMLQRLPWFRDALLYLDSADEFLRALEPADGQPGWATDPKYFSKVRQCGAEVEKLGGPRWE